MRLAHVCQWLHLDRVFALDPIEFEVEIMLHGVGDLTGSMLGSDSRIREDLFTDGPQVLSEFRCGSHLDRPGAWFLIETMSDDLQGSFSRVTQKQLGHLDLIRFNGQVRCDARIASNDPRRPL
jgi:hypothetical protein